MRRSSHLRLVKSIPENKTATTLAAATKNVPARARVCKQTAHAPPGPDRECKDEQRRDHQQERDPDVWQLRHHDRSFLGDARTQCGGGIDSNWTRRWHRALIGQDLRETRLQSLNYDFSLYYPIWCLGTSSAQGGPAAGSRRNRGVRRDQSDQAALPIGRGLAPRLSRLRDRPSPGLESQRQALTPHAARLTASITPRVPIHQSSTGWRHS